MSDTLLNVMREHARAIWQTAVNAVRPEKLIPAAFAAPSLRDALSAAPRILVVGAGKAGAAMAEATEKALGEMLEKVEGIVNVPADETMRQINARLRRIRLHAARPAGTNQPTAEGVAGAEQILELLAAAGPDDVALCLISGGGSALLPAPVEGVSLEDKQAVTGLLHACGATIDEMNAVRKHLSRVKGGRLARAFRGRALYSLIISDVVGDPLDVIASGPTAPDPTTFADALAILEKRRILHRVPAAVIRHLEAGRCGELEETPKTLPPNVHNLILGNNACALKAAQARARELGYRVLHLGSHIEGDTREVAVALAELVRAVAGHWDAAAGPVCVLSGGETTVKLGASHGLGGRNQEMVLAMLYHLGEDVLRRTVLLCAGTDGEDGPTDAAGAIADVGTMQRAAVLGLSAAEYLDRHDAYHFFEKTGDLLKTGLTQTNVMDVRVFLVA